MKPIDGYFLIKPEDLHWRPSNLMKIPNADFLERTKSEILGARLWRLPPKSALNSWLEKDGDRCFQLMETDDPSLFRVWTDRWKDLVSFEVVEIGKKPNEDKDAYFKLRK